MQQYFTDTSVVNRILTFWTRMMWTLFRNDPVYKIIIKEGKNKLNGNCRQICFDCRSFVQEREINYMYEISQGHTRDCSNAEAHASWLATNIVHTSKYNDVDILSMHLN